VTFGLVTFHRRTVREKIAQSAAQSKLIHNFYREKSWSSSVDLKNCTKKTIV
jgi:hypothetical protein